MSENLLLKPEYRLVVGDKVYINDPQLEPLLKTDDRPFFIGTVMDLLNQQRVSIMVPGYGYLFNFPCTKLIKINDCPCGCEDA